MKKCRYLKQAQHVLESKDARSLSLPSTANREHVSTENGWSGISATSRDRVSRGKYGLYVEVDSGKRQKINVHLLGGAASIYWQNTLERSSGNDSDINDGVL